MIGKRDEDEAAPQRSTCFEARCRIAVLDLLARLANRARGDAGDGMRENRRRWRRERGSALHGEAIVCMQQALARTHGESAVGSNNHMHRSRRSAVLMATGEAARRLGNVGPL